MPPQKKPKPQAQSKPEPRSWSPDVDISGDALSYRVSIALPGVDPKDVRAQIKNGVLTVQGHRKVLNLDLPPREVERTTENGLKRLFLEPVVDIDDFVCNIQLPPTLDVQRIQSLFERGSKNKSPDEDEGSRLNITIAESADPTYRPDRSPFDEFMLAKGASLPYEGDPFPIDIDTSKPANVDVPGSENHVERQMQDDDEQKVFVKDGVRYRTLSDAASLAKTHRRTLLTWIKNQTEFEGRPLKSYYLAPLDTHFISEESVQRVANRFVTWPSQEPIGPVTLGHTKDRSGFIGMSEAAEIVGVSRRTMWLWASQDKAPTDKPLDVIKCPASDYFYIRERDAYDLKKVVPRSGLHRGRRPQLALRS